jgi:hypothetical protein
MTYRLLAALALVAAVPALSTFAADAPGRPAFPGAEGFGAFTTGARAPGGTPQVVRVTTLEDGGPGSFREAVSKPNRVVVFDVSGVITLASNVEAADNLTILGQTAFAGGGEGICLYNRSVSFSEKKNVIVRYVRFREGIAGDRGKCSVNVANGSTMVFDHCSIQWGRWDSLGCTKGSRDMTFQDCIIGEAIDPQRFGALVDSVENITIARTLWVNNQSRNPKAKGTIEYINNVVYNYGGTGLAGGHSAADHWLDVINNCFIAGPSSTGHPIGGFSSSDKVFDAGNLVDLDRDGQFNPKPVTRSHYNDPTGGGESEGGTGGVAIPDGQKPYPTFTAAAWATGKPPVPVKVVSAEAALAHVMAEAGASLRRDPVDARIIAELKSLGKEGKVIKEEKEVGGIGAIKAGTPIVDADKDGIPDAWEAAHGLNPQDGADAVKVDPASGYLMIEVYANGLVGGK